MQKKHFTLSARTVQTLALGTLCAIGAFAAGIETAGDVHPFAKSEAALQELMTEGAEIRGDVNGNGKIDGGDAYALFQIVQGLEAATPDQIRRGDTDGDLQLTQKDLSRVLHTLSVQ